MSESAPIPPDRRTGKGRCPLCGRPRSSTWRPFCSRRCRDEDFLRWLDGRYRLPVGREQEQGEGEPPPTGT